MFLAGRTVCTNGFSKKKKMITKKYKEIIRAAKAGGEVAKKYFGKALEITTKYNLSDYRTTADLASEKAIIKILSKSFPKYNIISEEAGEINKNSEYTFYIDPIDGTNNFVLGIPYFSVGIALLKGDEMIFSAVYHPTLKNIYYAEKEKGAYLNNKRINANKETNIKNCTVSYVGTYSSSLKHKQRTVMGLEDLGVKRVMRNWSVILDYCLLASGKIEAVIIYGKLNLWDTAPGLLIAKEAGAIVTDYGKKKNDGVFLLATNGTKIHQAILDILNK